MRDLLRWTADHWAALLVACGALAATWRVAGRVWPVVRRIVQLVDDLTGEPARPGFDARPGVMERLQALDVATSAHGRVLAELLPNGGRSIKDTVTRIDERTAHLEQRLDAVERVIVPDQSEGDQQ